MSSMSMSQRIESERKDMKMSEIKDLVLDGCSATEIEGLTDEYSSLESLSIVGAGLTSLFGLPAFPALTKLNLAENPIAEGIDAIAKCSKLTSLNLSGNKLSSVSDLAPLASLECLCNLELNNCEIAAIDNYRKEVFTLLPQLKYLDGLDVNGEEESSDAAVHVGANGTTNGHAEVAQEEDNEEEDDEEEDEEEDDEEDIGISALQGSKELDDDEEDYVPGEEDDVEDEDDDGEDDNDEEDGDVDETDVIANLSGAGVTGSRRAAKRTAEADHDDATSAKHSAPDASGDAEEEEESNGV